MDTGWGISLSQAVGEAAVFVQSWEPGSSLVTVLDLRPVLAAKRPVQSPGRGARLGREVKVQVTQSHPTLCDPMDYTVHGILQARILEWAAFPFSRGSFQPRDQTQVSQIAGGFFNSWATREAQEYWRGSLCLLQQMFPTQKSNQGLLHCRQILYQLSCQGVPRQGREEAQEELQTGTRSKRRKTPLTPVSSQMPECLSGIFFFFQDILKTTEMGVILRWQSLSPALADF